jgi:hypothetical protein
MSHSLILIDSLSSASWKKGKKKRERNGLGLFSQGWTHLTGCAVMSILWLLGAIKCLFKDQSLNFICT